MTQALKKQHYTPEEYFALEQTNAYKSEYYQGDIFQMAGGSLNHNRIIGNVRGLLRQAFATRPYEVFSENVRLQVQRIGFYTYPDVMAICGDLQFAANEANTITNPTVIVEVLSESSENCDRTLKFGFYRNIESLRTYVLIDQKRIYIECFDRTETNQWLMTPYEDLAGVLILSEIAIELPLTEIYHKVKFGSTPVEIRN